MIEFEGFPKIPRLFRQCVVTEKIDGTNASVIIDEDGNIGAASRKRLITPENDNAGFAAWVRDYKSQLLELGPGRHFGEWWGSGIQRRYGLNEKRFSLFNVARWKDKQPGCCHVVPVLFEGLFDTETIREQLEWLTHNGSVAAPGFDRPEGIVVWHDAGRKLYKATIEKDEEWKGKT